MQQTAGTSEPKTVTTTFGGAPVFPADAKADVAARYQRVSQLLKEARAPAGWLELSPGYSALFVRDPEMVMELLTDSQRFIGGTDTMPEILDGSLSQVDDPQLHRQHREALAPHFRAAYVRGFVPHLTRTAQATAATLVALSCNGGSCNVEDLFRRVVLDNFGRTDLGFEFHAVEDMTRPYYQRHLYAGREFLEVWDRIMELSSVVVGTLAQRQQHPQYPEYTALLEVVRGVLRERIAAARQHLRQSTGITGPASHSDLVALLLQQQASGDYPHLTDDAIVSELMLMMLAGFDGTSTALSFALHHLVSSPPALAAALREISGVAAGRPVTELTFEDYRRMEYMSACLTETLRFHSTGSTRRFAAQDTTLGGGAVVVPQGSAVIISQYSMGRDDVVFEHADEWLPERWLRDGPQELKPRHKDAPMLFGLGPRICIGRQHVLLSVPVMLTQLLGSVRLTRAPGAPPIRLGPSLVARSTEGIWMTAEARALEQGRLEE